MHHAKLEKPDSNARYCLIQFIRHSGKDKIIGTEDRAVAARSIHKGHKSADQRNWWWGNYHHYFVS